MFYPVYAKAIKTTHGTEATVVTKDVSVKHQLNYYASHLTAELCAILTAMKLIKNINHSKFILYSNSRTAIKSINNNETSSEMIITIQELYHGITTLGKEVILVWNMNQDTEMQTETDRVVSGSTTDIPNTVLAISNTLQDLVKHIGKILEEKWFSIWTTLKRSDLHKNITNFQSLKHNKKLNRKEQVAITRTRTGHCKLSHLYLIDGSNPPSCDLCNTAWSLSHIVNHCPTFQHIRQRYLHDTSLECILESEKYQERILQFYKESGIFSQI